MDDQDDYADPDRPASNSPLTLGWLAAVGIGAALAIAVGLMGTVWRPF